MRSIRLADGLHPNLNLFVRFLATNDEIKGQYRAARGA
jgi:hypothetical protein